MQLDGFNFIVHKDINLIFTVVSTLRQVFAPCIYIIHLERRIYEVAFDKSKLSNCFLKLDATFKNIKTVKVINIAPF